jgi:hypothetical protein
MTPENDKKLSWLKTVITSVPAVHTRKTAKASQYAIAKSKTAKGHKMTLIGNDLQLPKGNAMENLANQKIGQEVTVFGKYEKTGNTLYFTILWFATETDTARIALREVICFSIQNKSL